MNAIVKKNLAINNNVYLNLFKLFSNFNFQENTSDILIVSEFKKELKSRNLKLNFTYLFDKCKTDYKIFLVYENNCIIYLWNANTEEKENIETEINIFRFKNNIPIKSGNELHFIKIFGEKD